MKLINIKLCFQIGESLRDLSQSEEWKDWYYEEYHQLNRLTSFDQVGNYPHFLIFVLIN